jgi:hypothetical protein
MWAVNANESALRAVKDRIAAAMGHLDDAAAKPQRKENYSRLSETAKALHECADEIQNILMRIRPRGL